MAPPPSKKTEAEKKAQKAKNARERRERKKTAKAQADDSQAGRQEPTPAPSNPASTPAPGQENDAPEPQYVTAHGAKTVNRKRAAPAEDEAPEEYIDDKEDDDDIDLTDFDHLTELVSEVTKLKLERNELDKEEVEEEKKYNLAKRLYEAGNLSKTAFDVKAKEWETALETGIAAHKARKVRLVNLENDIDKEFRRIATRMLVASQPEASAGNILEDFQDLSMYNRCGFLRTGNDHQQHETQRQQKEKRESRIEALADFWTLGLGRDSEEFDHLVRSLTCKTKDNTNDKNKKREDLSQVG